MTQSNVPRRRSGRRTASAITPPEAFMGVTAASRPRPMHTRPRAAPDPPTPTPPPAAPPSPPPARQPNPLYTPAPAHIRLQPSAPLLARFLPERWARWAFYAMATLLAVEVGALLLMHLTSRVLCMALVSRYGNYSCPL